jgi:hypothetical protein
MTEQQIKDFFSKPITIATGSFSTTDSFPGITTYYMPAGLFSAPAANVWTEKLKGYLGIRMTMNFKIVVNANRFQQGRYIMSYVPYAGAAYDSIGTPNINENLRLPTIIQRTTVPHVELDLNCDTSAEMSIPYSSIKTFFPAQELVASPLVIDSILGSLNVYPYSPLVTVSGATTASYRIYAWLTDVELIGAASAQSGLPRKEVSNKQNGIVSAPLSAISRGFREFESIPVLSSYAHTVSWIADRLAKTASIFGLSKPNQGDNLTKIVPLSAANHSNVDGDSDARSMAFMLQPGVQAVSGLSTTVLDEMDFSYVASKFSWVNSIIWTTAQVVDVNLTDIPLLPNYHVLTGTARNYNPMSFIVQHFKMWRGSMKFRFKFVKTEFHSGRLAFDFYPNSLGYSNVSRPEYVNRVIVDIREHSELEIVVPFISNAQYLKYDESFGTMKISVIDPLIAPATVANSVTILIELAAGPDFEVSQPGQCMTPTAVVPQSGLNECSLYSTTIGSSTINMNPVLASSVAAGDKVSSYRALVKRYMPYRWSVATDGAVALWNNFSISIIADALPIKGSDAITNYIEGDLYTMVASCYAIAGGGIRVRDVISTNRLTLKESPVQAVYHNSSGNVISGSALLLGVPSMKPIVVQESKHNAVISVELPQYSKYVGKATSDLFATSVFPYNAGGLTASGNDLAISFVLPANSGPILATTSNTTLHSLYRAGADDTNFYGFVSIPPMTPNVFDVWNAGYA